MVLKHGRSKKNEEDLLERLRGIWQVRWLKVDKLSKIVLFGQPSRAKWKAGLGYGSFLGGSKEGGFE